MYILSIDGITEKYHWTGGRRVAPGMRHVTFTFHRGKSAGPAGTLWSECDLGLYLSVAEGVAYRLSAEVSDVSGDGALTQGVRIDVKREEMAAYGKTHNPPAWETGTQLGLETGAASYSSVPP